MEKGETESSSVKNDLAKPGFSPGLRMSPGRSTNAKSGVYKSLWRDDFR